MASKLELISAILFLVLRLGCSESLRASSRGGDDSGLTMEERQIPPELNCENYPELLQDSSDCVNVLVLGNINFSTGILYPI